MSYNKNNSPTTHNKISSTLDMLQVSLRLGLTSFGGPTAHLGYFREEYVKRRRWLSEEEYADLVALCQFLPGPASSQVGIGIGLMRAGLPGALAAWAGFTLPSAVLLVLFALVFGSADLSQAGWIHGLKLAALAVVAQAVLGMGRSLAPDRVRATIAAAAAAALLVAASPWAQAAVIAAAGAAGWLLYRRESSTGSAARQAGGAGGAAGEAVAAAPLPAAPVAGTAPPQAGSAAAAPAAVTPPHAARPAAPSRRIAWAALLLFAALFLLLPAWAVWSGSAASQLAAGFYRAGALVFGGGHVVLPLLEQVTVPPGWVDRESFLAGYAAAQAVPGPLFTFAAYLGMQAWGLGGALLALAAIFTPAFLLVAGTLPFWRALRAKPAVQGVLKGVNAAVVGILAAALYHPVFTESVRAPRDLAFALLLFALLQYWRLPSWAVVAVAAAGGWALL